MEFAHLIDCGRDEEQMCLFTNNDGGNDHKKAPHIFGSWCKLSNHLKAIKKESTQQAWLVTTLYSHQQ